MAKISPGVWPYTWRYSHNTNQFICLDILEVYLAFSELSVVSSIMRKIVLALAEIHYRGRFAAPWFSSSGQGAKGQGRRYAACLALDALQPDCYQPTAWSCSRASRCFIFMYFLQPHWVPVT